MGTTLFDKLWDAHHIKTVETGADIIAIDRVFLHERTGSFALEALLDADRKVLHPKSVFCTVDHIVSIEPDRRRDSARMPGGGAFIKATRAAAKEAGIILIDVLDRHQGIVHIISPELGIALPGVSLVCPDSHTCSQGALGALAWGIGSTDAEHAMATGTLLLPKPPQMRIMVSGELSPYVTAKDLALHIIAKLGADGAKRCAVEFAGDAVEALSIEGRLTLCNLAVEFAAFTALVAPDNKTVAYVEGRQYAPKGEMWAQAVEDWAHLKTDPEARFDHEIDIDAASVRPTVTWGTSPAQAVAIDAPIPDVDAKQACDYMDLAPGQHLSQLTLGGAFIGSCTNGRLSDLRAAAKILEGKTVAAGIRAICVPGSMSVKRAAEAEGLDTVFKQAGFKWGAPGCAFCFYAGGDTFAPGTRVISSTNRNFESRQGPSVRTHLASPAVVAASAIAGYIVAPELGV